MPDIDGSTQTEHDAEVLRALLEHLKKRSDVQNIDLMNLAGFCRNCLSRWYAEAAARRGIEISKAESRERIYGMPYEDWQNQFQKEATPDQKAAFKAVMEDPSLTS
jgi:hypothetical protein